MSAKKNPTRRTKQEREEIKQLVTSIRERVQRYNITAYQLDKVVDMTWPALKNIVSGVTKTPNLQTLKEIDAYIIKTYETEEAPEVVKEEPAKYNLDQDAIKNIFDKLEKIEDKVDRNGLKQDIIFEIIRNSKEAELLAIDEAIKQRLNSLRENN